MELDITVSRRSAKGNGKEELFGDAFKRESRIVRKPKTNVKRRVTNEHTPVCSDLTKFGKTHFH